MSRIANVGSTDTPGATPASEETKKRAAPRRGAARQAVTDEDLDRIAGDVLFFGDQTERVLTERIAMPRPGEVVEIAIDLLDPDPEQPRKTFPERTLRELADTVEAHGVLQPIIIRPQAAGRRYWIVAGERRFRAARLAGLPTVPCILRTYTEEDAAVVALVENVHRDDLTDIEISDALWELKRRTGRTWEELAGVIRLGVPRVKQLAGLQELAEPVKAQVRSGLLSGRKALAIRPLPPPQQIQMAEEAATRSWTAEEIRSRVQQELGRTPRRGAAASTAHNPKGITRYTLSPTPDATDTTPAAGEKPSRRYPPETEDSAVGIPGVVLKCRVGVQEALRLLRSTGPGIVNPPYAGGLLQELDELREILLERLEAEPGWGSGD